MKVTDKNIKAMLQKYMDGLTSVAEEQMLTVYFKQAKHKNAPDGISAADWQTYKEMFAMFGTSPRRSRMTVFVRRAAVVAAVVITAVICYHRIFLHNNNHTSDNGAMVAKSDAHYDSTVVRIPVDTAKTETMPAVRKRIREKRRLRNMPPIPKHYLANNTTTDSVTAVDTEEAIRQTELLMKAIYIKQQNELNGIMAKYAMAIAEFEESYEEEEIY